MSERLDRAARIALTAALAVTIGCSNASRDPAKAVVAEVDGLDVTLGDVEIYLRENLGETSAEEPQDAAESDAVKSRLLDDLLDETLLLAEARRRGVTVSDDELAGYLGSEVSPTSTDDAAALAAADRARRTIMIQKLRQGVADSAPRPSVAELDAYVTAHRDTLRPPRRVALRSLHVDDLEKAEALLRDLRGRRTTFASLLERHGTPADRTTRIDVPLDDLPADLRILIADRKPGEVSQPLLTDGGACLFYVEGFPPPEPLTEKELRGRAEERLMLDRQEAATRQLLVDLRGRARTRLDEKKLPFRYVEDSDSTRRPRLLE